MDQVCKRSYTEILEIIKYLPKDEYDRIPKEEIEFYNENKDNSYSFSFDPNKTLQEQNISRETNALIVMLFRNYIATEQQKEKLDIILKQNEEEYQAKLREQYSYDKLFKNSKELSDSNEKSIERQTESIEPNQLEKEKSENVNWSTQKMVVYNKGIWARIRHFLKSLFKKF